MISNAERTDWKDRAGRLARSVAKAPVVAGFPLLQVVRMPELTFNRLEGAVTAYLWHSLSCAFPGRAFTLGKALIAEYVAELLALPNRTPNGVILPRRNTFYSFNMIHQALADAVEAAGFLSSFSYLQIPCNVRLVEGTPDPQAEGRSYASTKIHTDVWNGEPISSILFNIPVLGDPEGVDLRFYEPKQFSKNLQAPLSDYALGTDVAASAEEYPGIFRMGNIYVSDALSLHRTVKRRATLRVSLDFRAIARELLPDESADHSASRATYVEPAVWRACGSTIVLGSGEPIDAFQRRQAGETVLCEGLSIFNIDDAN